jgi:hypothetical protein
LPETMPELTQLIWHQRCLRHCCWFNYEIILKISSGWDNTCAVSAVTQTLLCRTSGVTDSADPNRQRCFYPWALKFTNTFKGTLFIENMYCIMYYILYPWNNECFKQCHLTWTWYWVSSVSDTADSPVFFIHNISAKLKPNLIFCLVWLVRYHIEGSMKLNARILHLANMVYL